MQRPIAETVGTVVGVDVVDVVDVVGPLVDVVVGVFGIGAPVENRQPAPGALNAAMLMMGGGRLCAGGDGWVVGVVDVDVRVVVVGSEAVVVGVVRIVVDGAAAGER